MEKNRILMGSSSSSHNILLLIQGLEDVELRVVMLYVTVIVIRLQFASYVNYLKSIMILQCSGGATASNLENTRQPLASLLFGLL
jgi:hypothetical protein